MTIAETGYRATLKVRGALPLLTAGVIGRAAGGILPFSLIVAISDKSGFALAGIGAAAFMLAGAFTGPRRGRLVDVHGRRALIGLALAHSAAFAAVILLLMAGWTIAAICMVAVASALAPPIAAALRSRWSGIMPDKNHLQQIHSLDSVVEEITFVIAPLAAMAVMTLSSAHVSIILGALLPIPASAILSAYPATSRPEGDHAGNGERRSTRRSLILTPVGQGIVLPIVALGVFGGGLSVVLPGIADRNGDIESAGYYFAAFSLGGVIGGLVYGKIRSRASLRSRYLAASAYLAFSAGLVAATVSTPFAIPAVFLAGFAVTPLFVVGYLLVDEGLPADRLTEANAWLGSGYNVGSGAGSALCGLILATVDPQVAAVGLLAVTIIGVASALRLPAARAVPQKEPAPTMEA